MWTRTWNWPIFKISEINVYIGIWSGYRLFDSKKGKRSLRRSVCESKSQKNSVKRYFLENMDVKLGFTCFFWKIRANFDFFQKKIIKNHENSMILPPIPRYTWISDILKMGQFHVIVHIKSEKNKNTVFSRG